MRPACVVMAGLGFVRDFVFPAGAIRAAQGIRSGSPFWIRELIFSAGSVRPAEGVGPGGVAKRAELVFAASWVGSPQLVRRLAFRLRVLCIRH